MNTKSIRQTFLAFGLLAFACISSHAQITGLFNPVVDPPRGVDTDVTVDLMQDGQALKQGKEGDYEAVTDDKGDVTISMTFTIEDTNGVYRSGDEDTVFSSHLKWRATLPDGSQQEGESFDGSGFTRDAIDSITFSAATDTKSFVGQTIKVEALGLDPNETLGSVDVTIACGSCSGGSCSAKVNAENGCLKFSVGVAGGKNGRSRGQFWVLANTPSADLVQPSGLNFLGSPDITLIRDANNAPRQVLSQTDFVDVVTTGPAAYEMRFYAAGQQGSLNGGIYGAPSVAPRKTVRVEGSPTGDVVSLIENPGASGELRHDYTFNATKQDWTLAQGGVVTEKETTVSGNYKTEITEVRAQDGPVVSRTSEKLRKFNFGERVIERIEDPQGLNLVTTYEYYLNGPSSPTGAGQIKQETRPDGSWTRYEYDGNGRRSAVITPLGNAGPQETGNVRRRTITYGSGDLVQTEVETVAGQVVSRRWLVRDGSATKTIRATDPAAASWNDTGNLVSLSENYTSGNFRGLPKRSLSENGQLTTYSYSQSGTQRTTTRETGMPNAGSIAVADGVRTTSVVNEYGVVISEAVTSIPNGLTLSSWTATATDDRGRVTAASHSDGTTESWSFGLPGEDCCQMSSHTDRQGVTTSYGYDALGRQTITTRLGISDKVTLDAAGRVTKRERIGTDNSIIVQEETTYDLAGRVTQTQDAMGGITTVSYSPDGRTTTTTHPDGGTRIETSYADGRLQEISGTGANPASYAYGAWSGGEWTQEFRTTSEWVKTYTDFAGRSVKMEYPDGAFASMTYNAKGQLTQQMDPDGVTTLTEYDGRGRVVRQAVDLNGNAAIDLAADRVTETVHAVANAHGTTVNRTTTSVYASGSTPTTVSVSEQSTDGRSQWQTRFGNASSTVASTPSNGAWTVTTTNPDGTSTVQTITDTRPTAIEQKASGGATLATTTVTYDGHGRQLTQTDGRTGTTTFAYNDRDQVVTETAPAATGGGSPLVTGYGYDAMGRRTSVTLPDNSVTTTGYDLRGNATSQGGSQQYDVTSTFDPQGRLLTMTTTGQAGNATTTWIYNPQRGWLDRKEYADNRGTDYTYTPGGRLLTRTWARTAGGNSLVTTYGYNAAGDLTSTDYSDSTPDVTMSYTRFGGVASTTDATGTRLIGYNAQLQPETETLPATFYGGRILTRTYDSLHRPTGIELGTSADPDADHVVTYGFDPAGRLATVADANTTWTYGFVANAPNLLSSVTTGARTVTYTYEPGRNAITSITNEVGSTTVSAYTYTNNAIGQRTARSQSGTAFAASASETFGYNSKGEVTSTTHDVDTARDTAFAYDGIGNRNTATFAGLTTDYTANLLNQYTEVDPGTPATPTYDDDGNLIGNGTDREFSYDGENRLVEVRDASNTLLATYTYDGQGRRAKRVTTGAAPQGASEEVYLYDGWNRVATYDASSGLLNTQTWGRDLSGTLEGAGGVGGLLGVQESVGPHAGNYTLQYDANGNVSEVLTASGAIAAHYEYDAFGDEVVSTGSYAAVNPWRFSTKPVDAETGYSYYGYRYYNPDTGRWLNRDPIGEEGWGESLWVRWE